MLDTLPPRSARSLARLACSVALVACSACVARAQLVAEKLYNGINRPLTVNVTLPADAKGDTRIQLLEPVTAKMLAEAKIETALPGSVDLARLFPQLWSDEAPRVFYAQLLAGDQKIGPALVLQPMLNPARASLDERNPRQPIVVYPPAKQPTKKAYSGLRVYTDKHVLLNTEAGDIQIALRPDAAPNTAWNFRHLVEGGYFDDTDFFRIIAVGSQAGKGFVIQGGDPSNTSPRDGGPGYNIQLEPSSLPHDFGVISMARDRDPDTAGSQFFICLSREETARLDGSYCTFGQAVSGAAPINKIANAPLAAGKSDQPIKPPKLKKATLIDAPPYGTGPAPLTLDGNKPGAR